MARTKVDGGAVSRTAGAYNGLRGAVMTATTTKQPLTVAIGGATPPAHYQCVKVIVQAASTNGQTIVNLGDSRYQTYELAASANVTLDINDLDMAYAKVSSGTAVLNLLIFE